MSTENKKKWQKIVAKAWMDEDYKNRLLEDPNSVLQEEGVEIPEGVSFRVMEDSDQVKTLVLPWPKVEGSVDEMEERLAAFGYIGF